jgi:ribosome biogenesis protein ERB1
MDPEDRPTNFIPRKCDSLRKMEAYDKIINERFERCLDLYLSARLRKKKLNMNPEALIPNLPKP